MEESVHEQVPYVEREGDVGTRMDGVNAEKGIWTVLHDCRLPDKNVRNLSVTSCSSSPRPKKPYLVIFGLVSSTSSLLVPLFSTDSGYLGNLSRSGEVELLS